MHNEPVWVLSRAYNLAAAHARCHTLVKVDCDYTLSPTFLSRHPLPPNTFYTGHYENARAANQIHLNGALVVSRAAFRDVGGYDERIQTYGFDDDDLYTRLRQAGLARRNLSYEVVDHVAHGAELRVTDDVRFPRAQIDVNRLLLEKVASPWGKRQRASEYGVAKGGGLVATFVPRRLEDLVGEEVRKETWKLALGRRLRDDFRVPWGVISGMRVGEMEKLLRGLNSRKERMGLDEVVEKGVSVRLLFLHVQHGLGNRLRVLASGLAFARKTGRECVVIWERDVHFGGAFGDVFEGAGFAVVDRLGVKWPLAAHVQYDAAWGDVVFYNYMLGERKEVVDDKGKNLYFKSAAIMKSGVTSWETENEELKRLKVRKEVRALVDGVTAVVGGKFDRVGGIHIRNKGLDEDIEGVKDNRALYDEKDAAEIAKWRGRTKYTAFVGEMRMLLKNGTVERFFVASDTRAVLEKLEGMFKKGRILYIRRDCDDRGDKCVRYGMADLVVLARTKVLLGSTWSSFTEAAMRLGGPKARLAGTDFE